jgi:hypothetical protein
MSHKRPIFLVLVVSLLVGLLLAVFPVTVQAQDPDPWNEVFDANGNFQPGLIDLGVTSETPSWMTVDLPFDQTLNLTADYHRYQTPSGNIVVLPSASTLFFMAMHPAESGLLDSAGMVSNGYGQIIDFLGLVAGNSIDWNRLFQDHPEYQRPEDFWNAVLSGRENAFTYFSGWGFITNLLSMSWNDAALRTMFLLYLNGSGNCAAIPGGCSGVVGPLPPPSQCPGSSVAIQQPTTLIQKTAPNYPLVVGQDPQEKRGADIQVSITVPPVLFTWYEALYDDDDVCRDVHSGETANCKKSSRSAVNDGVSDHRRVFIGCQQHVEHLPDAVSTLRATAKLSADSKAWIVSNLGQSHYGATVHQEQFNLVPGLSLWSGSCDGGGTCRATATITRVPFADPGTFQLELHATTKGASFLGIPITQPRTLTANGTLQVYVTLPALVP